MALIEQARHANVGQTITPYYFALTVLKERTTTMEDITLSATTYHTSTIFHSDNARYKDETVTIIQSNAENKVQRTEHSPTNYSTSFHSTK